MGSLSLPLSFFVCLIVRSFISLLLLLLFLRVVCCLLGGFCLFEFELQPVCSESTANAATLGLESSFASAAASESLGFIV